MKRNSHAAPLNIQKLNYSKFASLTIYAIDSFGSFWLRVSLESRLGLSLGLGFRFWASGLLKSKVFFLCANRLLHIVYLLLLLVLQLLLLLLFVMPIKLVKYLLMF